jgi:hypothetical protein
MNDIKHNSSTAAKQQKYLTYKLQTLSAAINALFYILRITLLIGCYNSLRSRDLQRAYPSVVKTYSKKNSFTITYITNVQFLVKCTIFKMLQIAVQFVFGYKSSAVQQFYKRAFLCS